MFLNLSIYYKFTLASVAINKINENIVTNHKKKMKIYLHKYLPYNENKITKRIFTK